MIGKETIDRIRELTGIVTLIGESVKLQRRGRSYLGLCPFHKEKTPSFHVNDERGIYHCFGCGVTGDVFRFVQESEGLSFREAAERLAERAGITIVDDSNTEDQRLQREKRKRDQALFDVTNAAAAYFERMLREHPLREHPHAELERRQLVAGGPTDAIAHALQSFRIGYAPYGWNSLADHLRHAGLSLAAAETVGLIVPRKVGPGHYDRFRHRLMFAIVDVQGRVVGFSGRALTEPATQVLERLGLPLPRAAQGEVPAKYLNSPESPIYRKRDVVFGLHQARSTLRSGAPCIVVEGNFDVVSLHARGLTQAVAPLGTAFTVEQARQIKRFASEAILLFDADDAGRRAVRVARAVCDEAAVGARVAVLPEGADPDDFVRTRGAEALQSVLDAARGVLEYLIDVSLDTAFVRDDARARAAKIQEVVALLGSEPDPSVRALAEQHADRIVERLGVSDARTFEALKRKVRQSLAEKAGPPSARPLNPSEARCRDRRHEVSVEILGALLDYPQLFDTPEFVAGVEQLEGDVAAAVAALRGGWNGSALKDVDSTLGKLAPALRAFVGARLAAPRLERLEDARSVIYHNFEKLGRLERQRQRSEMVEELYRAKATGDYEQQFELLREHMRRAKQKLGQ